MFRLAHNLYSYKSSKHCKQVETMNFQTAVTILLSTSAIATAQNAAFTMSSPDPVCAKFDTIEVNGLAKFVDTDASGPGITTGKSRHRKCMGPSKRCLYGIIVLTTNHTLNLSH